MCLVADIFLLSLIFFFVFDFFFDRSSQRILQVNINISHRSIQCLPTFTSVLSSY